jgi:MoaA/NifB/PqqE/SkfB family radical SAM enzyme
MKKNKILQKMNQYLLEFTVNYIGKNPVRNLKHVLWAIKKLGLYKELHGEVDGINNELSNPNSSWVKFLNSLKSEINEHVYEMLLKNMLLKGSLISRATKDYYRSTQKMQVPWAVLMDPTTACNLDCIGCWASEYSREDSLSYELMDRIIREGKEIGTYIYILTGGEPLMRKKDIIKLCETHDDCYFLAFTNGTLVDEKFAKEIKRVGNFTLAFSIEGFEKENDARRGKGVYAKVIKAMEIMKKHGNLFGYSTVYHRNNTEVVGSHEFVNYMEEMGCRFGWNFTYMPVGTDAPKELIVTPEQRKFMFHKIREIRNSRALFLMDFWNDGEYTGGCIAGGRKYFHINAKGDAEPCAFIHYSNMNIKDHSLLEVLKQPLFEEYRKAQPFNHNHMRPCPCLDNPEKLRMMVNNAKAPSTQLHDNESVEHYTSKCEAHAASWAPVSDHLWKWDHETKIDHKAEADKMWEMIKNIPKVDIGIDPETKKEEARKLKAEIKKNSEKSKKAKLSGIKVEAVFNGQGSMS